MGSSAKKKKSLRTRNGSVGRDQKKKTKSNKKRKNLSESNSSSESSDADLDASRSKKVNAVKKGSGVLSQLKALTEDETYASCQSEAALALKWFSTVIHDMSKCYKVGRAKCNDLSSSAKNISSPTPQDVYKMYNDIEAIISNCNDALMDFRQCVDEYFVNWIQLIKKSVRVTKEKEELRDSSDLDHSNDNSGSEECTPSKQVQKDNRDQSDDYSGSEGSTPIKEVEKCRQGEKKNSSVKVSKKENLKETVPASPKNESQTKNNKQRKKSESSDSEVGNESKNGIIETDNDVSSGFKPLLRIKNVDEVNESLAKKADKENRKGGNIDEDDVVCLDSDAPTDNNVTLDDSDNALECLSIRSTSPEVPKTPSPSHSSKTVAKGNSSSRPSSSASTVKRESEISSPEPKSKMKSAKSSRDSSPSPMGKRESEISSPEPKSKKKSAKSSRDSSPSPVGKRKSNRLSVAAKEEKKVSSLKEKQKIVWSDSSDDEVSSDLSSSDVMPKSKKKSRKAKDLKKGKSENTKKKSKKDKSDSGSGEKSDDNGASAFSDSEDDLQKLLDLKSLKDSDVARIPDSPSSSSAFSPTPKKDKAEMKKKSSAKKSNDLAEILGSGGSDNSVGGLSDGKEWELTSLSVAPSATSIAQHILSVESPKNNDSDSGLSVVLSGDEKKERKKKTKKEPKVAKICSSDSSDSSMKEKKSSKNKLKKDKLLSEKLTDTDTEEEEARWRESTLKRKKKDSSTPRKNIKRTKIFSTDEEGSNPSSQDESETKKAVTSSSSSEEERPVKKKRRRRVKNSTDSSNSDGESQKITDSGGKGKRKNIRKVLKEDDLKKSTKTALKEEEERKKRIQEKQKMYNLMMELAGEESTKLESLVLDFDEKTKKPVVSVDSDLVKKLKPHQGDGVKFMWDSCFETVKDAQKGYGSGCILAHCMGLGKSLQVVTLLHTILMHDDLKVKTALVVCPFSTVLNWVNEFDKWLNGVGSGNDIDVQHLTKTPATHRAYHLRDWHKNGGVMIMGYNMLRSLIQPPGRVKASFKKIFQETLCDPGPDIIICDEGHVLKNESTSLSKAMCKIKTKRRIVLTGTPLQNNLMEYHCMVQFVKPNLLGDKKEFKNRFVNPIQNGQFEDSTAYDVKIMKRRAHVLHKMLDGVVQRRDYNILTPYLPTKFEYVINLSLSTTQVNLYRHYLQYLARNGQKKAATLFKDWQELSRICTHPRVLMMHSDHTLHKRELEEDDSEGSLKDFICDKESDSESESSTSSSLSSKSSSEPTSKKRRRTRANAGSSSESEVEVTQQRTEWWSTIVSQEEMDDINQSPKLFLLFTIIQKCQEIGDKLLIFSQSLFTLDLIEYFLNKIDEDEDREEKNPGLCGFTGTWVKNVDYFRLDGKDNHESRSASCKTFNNTKNSRGRLFLISTKAGGLGINLTGANRVVLFDASWNPSHDVQSIFRVYRFGQTKPCYIYRFLAKGTMEEKVYDRQVAKLSTSLRVIDEQQIDRHFSHNDLLELYNFDPEAPPKTTPMLPKDRLMAELLQAHGNLVLSHHQHDSLLENQEDEELNEEERKQAWLDFENEKNAPPPPPPMVMGTNNSNAFRSITPEMFVSLQQTLRKQNPDWSEEKLRLTAVNVLQKAYQSLNHSQNNPFFLQGGMAYPTVNYPGFNQPGQNPITLPMRGYLPPATTNASFNQLNLFNQGNSRNTVPFSNVTTSSWLPTGQLRTVGASGNQGPTAGVSGTAGSSTSNTSTLNRPKTVIDPNETIVLDQ